MPFVETLDARGLRSLAARLRENLGQRATGAIVALAIEALLLLVLLTLNDVSLPHKEVPLAVTSFDAREESKKKDAEPAAKPDKGAPPKESPSPARQAAPAAATIAPVQPPAAIIPVSPQQMGAFDISKLPRKGPPAPPGPVMGPANTPRFGDSQQVGTAPNGQPMYAASWYPHEPTHQEMAGYLSTADPGWALITCKTVPDYRVEDCVGLDEYPAGSHLLRAVLAAAWQFRVRPPRVGGVLEVGDWVRIRITYEERPASPYGDPSGR